MNSPLQSSCSCSDWLIKMASTAEKQDVSRCQKCAFCFFQCVVFILQPILMISVCPLLNSICVINQNVLYGSYAFQVIRGKIWANAQSYAVRF